MHKSITKINKAAIIIIYHHGTNFCNFSNDIIKVVIFINGDIKLKYKLKINIHTF